VLLIGTDIWTLLIFVPALLTPHYSIEYRTYFTHFHNTISGAVGQTESIIIMICLNLIAFFHPLSNGIFKQTLLSFRGMDFSYSNVIVFTSFLIGVYVNMDNFYHGFKQAKDKVKAMLYITPILHLWFLVFISAYS